MKKTPRAEERQFLEWEEQWVQFKMNDAVQDEWKKNILDTSFMKFQNQGLRENPESHRETTGYWFCVQFVLRCGKESSNCYNIFLLFWVGLIRYAGKSYQDKDVYA